MKEGDDVWCREGNCYPFRKAGYLRVTLLPHSNIRRLIEKGLRKTIKNGCPAP